MTVGEDRGWDRLRASKDDLILAFMGEGITVFMSCIFGTGILHLLGLESRSLISYEGVYTKRLRRCYAMLCPMRLKASNAFGAFDMTIRYPGYPHTVPLT